MAITLRPLEPACAPAWDAFVRGTCPRGHVLPPRRLADVITGAFGHPCHYVFAEQDGAITGVLPLAHVRTRLFGNTLISVPFCVYGGPLAADAETAAALESTRETLCGRARRRRRGVPPSDRGRQRLVVATGPLCHVSQADRRR